MSDSDRGDLRSDIADALQGWMTPDQLRLLLDEILAVKKGAHVEVRCKHCGKSGKYQAEVSDAKAVVGALADLANQGFGRPKEAAQAEAERIVFERVVYMTDEPEGVPV